VILRYTTANTHPSYLPNVQVGTMVVSVESDMELSNYYFLIQAGGPAGGIDREYESGDPYPDPMLALIAGCIKAYEFQQEEE
jgi:hypothetical protein